MDQIVPVVLWLKYHMLFYILIIQILLVALDSHGSVVRIVRDSPGELLRQEFECIQPGLVSAAE